MMERQIIPGGGGHGAYGGYQFQHQQPYRSSGVNVNAPPPSSGSSSYYQRQQDIIPPPLTSSPLLIDYRRGQNRFIGARFIFECGIKLEARPMTIATAATLYHKFFQQVDEKQYDYFLIGACCLYLAGKHENQNLKIRDVVNVAYATVHRNDMPLDLNEKYFGLRDSLVQAELLILRVLKFQMDFQPPHKFLVHYLKTLEEWVGYDGWSKAPVARTAWSLLQDFHHDPSVISYPAQALAIAAIKLAMDMYGAQAPLCSSMSRNNWQCIMYPNFDPDVQDQIMSKIVGVYEQEDRIITPSLLHCGIGGDIVNGK